MQHLPSPEEIKKRYPLSAEIVARKTARDEQIRRVFTGEDNRLLLLIGPCSADHEDSVMTYINKLADLQEKVKDRILIVPRVYTNKPRTTGDGYKGMVHQPDPTKKADMLAGLLSIRKLHTRVIAETGFGCADEMLYSENYAYLDDLLSYIAIGARSVEDQQHRLTSSGIDVPVGMKNPTSGDYSVMLNSITAAQHPHTFIYRGQEVRTDGNPLAHAILRGLVDKHGQSFPNYHFEDLIRLHDQYAAKGLQNMAVIVDANHANSGKQYLEQIRICKEVAHSRRHSADIHQMVRGLMVESYLEDGCQPIDGGIYGKSITDPCLGWDKTEQLVLDLAEYW